MKQFSNYDKVKAASDAPVLPAGGYICEIKKAEVKTYKSQDGNNFEKFEISIDICEGEYSGFYADNYRAQQQEDKKWKGVLRLYMPKDDGSEKDEWTKSRFKAVIEAIEDSNPGYHWDWDENKLKGKKVGCLFRNEEWEYDGKNGWKAMPFKFIAADKIKSGNFKVPKDKPLDTSKSTPSYSSTSSDAFREIPDDDLPF